MLDAQLLESQADIVVRVRKQLMACEFEVLLVGRDAGYLRDAGEEALGIAEELERQLSVFLTDSEVSYINAMAPRQAVRVEPRLYKLLRRSARLTRATHGAFDISLGRVIKAWNAAARSRRMPTDKEIECARRSAGAHLIQFNDEDCTVCFLAEGVEINLGGIGKGYAVDEMAALLKERGIPSGLITAGTSTVYAFGRPPGSKGWTVGIRGRRQFSQPVAIVSLVDQALSTSGGYEQYFELEGRQLSHVLDPRTGYPADGLVSASAIQKSATDSDALATAFFVLGAEGTAEYCRRHPDTQAILVIRGQGETLNVMHC